MLLSCWSVEYGALFWSEGGGRVDGGMKERVKWR